MIRPIARADRAAVLGLIEATAFFRPDEIRVAAELIDAVLEDPDHPDYRAVVIIAFGDDGGGDGGQSEVAGYLTYGPTPLTLGTYDLYWMAVSPGHQGRGYGRALVEWLEGRVKEEGGRMIIIETSSTPQYDPTRRFYLGLHYTEVARVPDFYKPGDDRIIYAKHLVEGD